MKNRLLSLVLMMFTALGVTAQVPSYVPTNGLVGWWPFNGNANDESGNGNNGTVSGATLSADRFGNANSAYSFDGTTNYITIPSLPITGNNNRAVSFWLESMSNAQAIVSIGPSAGFNQCFNVCLNLTGAFQGQPVSSPIGVVGVMGFNNDFYPSTGTNVANNNWNFVVVTFDGSLLNIYVNGILDNYSYSYIYNTQSSQNNFFGKKNDASPLFFHGNLDDIAIFNRALTADEVLALYNGCNVTPQAIAGNTTPNAFANSTYTCTNNAGSTYAWTVSNGVIASGQGTNSVNILWGAEGVGSVSVVETTADGCVGDAVVYDVNVQCVVSGNAISGPVGPEAFSNSTYTCNGAANSTYNWTVTNGVIVSGQGTNTVNILWASSGIGNVSVVETTAEGCVGATLSQDVVVIPTNVEELSNAFTLYPNPVSTSLNIQTTSELIGTDLFVFDALGKQILKQQILSTNTIINTSSFAAGNYVVKVGGGVKRFEVVR